ncbi:proteasome subunit beta type-1, putative [Plasmodium ovale wallikeri]|uniref:Proteasome subunit beta type-1, putative n=1 Tax=Plasmodium ovale wallikeri TaxID=864142 RepID=A0A1A8YYI6_PLAOA|nr:proteasome subunit beta type-1, putative [Plasmodium ovale wallikeri]
MNATTHSTRTHREVYPSTIDKRKMEILPISDNSTNKRAEGKEGIIECGRSSKRWYPYIDNGGYGEAIGKRQLREGKKQTRERARERERNNGKVLEGDKPESVIFSVNKCAQRYVFFPSYVNHHSKLSKHNLPMRLLSPFRVTNKDTVTHFSFSQNCYRPNGKGLCDFSSRHASVLVLLHIHKILPQNNETVIKGFCSVAAIPMNLPFFPPYFVTVTTDKCVIGSSGMQSDIKTLHALLKKKIKIFFLEHAHYPDIHVIARLLCVILYSRRFFPYYTFNILAGMSEDNESVLYNYDAIGSYCGATHSCVGSGAALILPILDNRVEQKNQLIKNVNFNLRDDIDFVKDAITSATERDIYTGDQAEIYIIDSMGVNTTSLDLKQD